MYVYSILKFSFSDNNTFPARCKKITWNKGKTVFWLTFNQTFNFNFNLKKKLEKLVILPKIFSIINYITMATILSLWINNCDSAAPTPPKWTILFYRQNIVDRSYILHSYLFVKSDQSEFSLLPIIKLFEIQIILFLSLFFTHMDSTIPYPWKSLSTTSLFFMSFTPSWRFTFWKTLVLRRKIVTRFYSNTIRI